MLIIINNKIFNMDNVNLLSYTPGENGKPSIIQIIFQRNQWDDTNSIHTLKGDEADSFWNKVKTQAT